MGYNTSVTILNDGMDQIRRNPTQFVGGLDSHLRRGGSFGVGNHANPVLVHPSEHADVTQLIAVGGNFSTVLHAEVMSTRAHHTRAAQVELLRAWGNALGCVVVEGASA